MKNFILRLPTLAFHGISCDSARNYQLIDHKNGFSAVNYQLRDKKSTRGRGFRLELLAYLLGFRPVRSKLAENPLNGNNSRISSSKSYILTITTSVKF
jgi:hypothetical protein